MAFLIFHFQHVIYDFKALQADLVKAFAFPLPVQLQRVLKYPMKHNQNATELAQSDFCNEIFQTTDETWSTFRLPSKKHGCTLHSAHARHERVFLCSSLCLFCHRVSAVCTFVSCLCLVLASLSHVIWFILNCGGMSNKCWQEKKCTYFVTSSGREKTFSIK